AFGHGCSVSWDQNAESVDRIQSTFIPSYETESMTPDVKITIEGKEIPLIIRMQDLAKANTYNDIEKILLPLIEGYGKWILMREIESDNLPTKLEESAIKNLTLCKDSLIRMER